jgi:tetratricopeptide (TPR) repeat protein
LLLLIILYSCLLGQVDFEKDDITHFQYRTLEVHKRKLDTIKNPFLKTIHQTDLSWDYIFLDLDSAMHYNNLALINSFKYSNQASKYNDEYHIDLHAKVLSVRGEIFKFKAMYDSALYYENKAIEIRDSIDFYGFKYSYIVKGDVYLEKGNYLLAQLNYKKAFESVMQAMRYYNLPAYTFESEEFYNILYYLYKDGLFSFKEERYTKDNIENAKIKYKNLNKVNVSRALFNYFEVILKMGTVETQLGNYTKALDYFSRIKPFLELHKPKYYSVDYFVIENLYYLGHTYR